MAVFPGDTPFREEFLAEMKKGDNLTLSKIETTVHLGAHTDAPNHYSSSGESIETRSLETYMGPVQIIEVPCKRGARVVVKDFANKPILAKRILFKTMSFPNPYEWNSDFMSLSSEVITHLAKNKVVLVGIDTPSIDLCDDKVLESHQAVFKNDMAILEGVVLETVAEGLYHLVALPLKIEGADATPVRAILLR